MAASVPDDDPTIAASVVMATQDDFEAIFRYPTLDKMFALSWRDFERFIAHVFTCAGYRVEDVARDFFPDGPGVDLNLYASQSASSAKPVARVEIKRWRQQLQLDHVRQFIGTLRIAGDIPGYLVSTGGFADRAQIAAEMARGHVRLIDGDRLLRYIAYVGGSRLNGMFAGRAVAPAQPLSPAWLEQGDLFTQRTALRSRVSPASHPPRRARVLTIANIKGGVAKTTSALNIALALSDLHDKRVLLLDLDGQASLTRSLPAPPSDLSETPTGAATARGARTRTTASPPAPPERDTTTLADYLRGSAPLTTIIRPTRFAGVWLAPAAHDLYRLQIAGADRAQLELALAEAIRIATIPDDAGVAIPPDWIILDTPAGDTFYARAALTAADHILIPAYPETYGAFGLDETLQLIRTMNALTTTTAAWRQRLLGCVVTRWRAGTNATANLATLKTLLANERIRLFQSLIPLDERVETANRGAIKGERRGLFHLSAQPGPAAPAYDAVAQEIEELTTHAD